MKFCDNKKKKLTDKYWNFVITKNNNGKYWSFEITSNNGKYWSFVITNSNIKSCRSTPSIGKSSSESSIMRGLAALDDSNLVFLAAGFVKASEIDGCFGSTD